MRHNSLPPQCDPARRAFCFIGDCKSALTNIRDYSPDANQSTEYLPGLKAVMSRDHIVGKTADDAPASRSTSSTLPVKSAAHYIHCLSCTHFLHRFVSFQTVKQVVLSGLRIVKTRELISHDGTVNKDGSSVSVGYHPTLIRRVFIL